jgi:glycosyltransferase involved in cell wall biosynthesis
MEIGLVYDTVYPHNKAGREKRLYDIIKKLKRKHEIHVYCMKCWKGKKVINKKGVYYHAISKYIPLYTKNGQRSIWQGIYFGFSCLKLIKEDFDFLDVDEMPFFPLFFSKIVCALKGKKMIATWNEVWGYDYWTKYLGWKGLFGYLLEKISVSMPDKIISISRHTTEKLMRKMKVNEEKIVTIPIGIDLEKISAITAKKEKNKVVYVGRLIAHKNVDLLIRALTKLKRNVRLSIVGEGGPEKERLERLAEELKVNAKFSEFERHNEVIKEMKSSSVLVLPSSREGFGIVVIEANACGVPVITVDEENNAAKELIIDGKNGFVCKLDEKALAEKIEFLLNKNYYKTMEKNCIDESKNYDLEILTRKIEEVYKNEQ